MTAKYAKRPGFVSEIESEDRLVQGFHESEAKTLHFLSISLPFTLHPPLVVQRIYF